ncbi:hypothetical protein CVD28_02220 [Bacillus sp. M6-12]|uniref:hypothetical protein n=1 Tax=Bacillus sp. M6-12 TaxID=2054166 RepID=UPI000C793921|nr:hypothetical protein [Bacillus sp. M6-12]PLS19248.1 hypothetical protein CVD28_02220 [Bacillus sp. M6-12]
MRLKQNDSMVIPTSEWLISFFTDTKNPMVTKRLHSLDKGEISLFLPSCVIVQTMLELKEQKGIPYQESALAFLSLMDTGCLELEERNVILNTLHRFKKYHSNSNLFDIYIACKAEEMKIRVIK